MNFAATQIAFSVHLTEHCNLNCKGCNNFAPLADKHFTQLESAERDFKRLSELTDGVAYKIRLTGGEPLLHPHAIEFGILARKYFPDARICFITNGVLARKQNDEFFKKCRKYDIEIDLTPYPIGIDYEELNKWIKEKGVNGLYHQPLDIGDNWRRETLNLYPLEDASKAVHNWMNCYAKYFACIQLINGKMGCNRVMCVKHLIKRFPEECKHIYTTSQDYIDIYKINDKKEIIDFFSKPFPFCRYCNVDNWSKGEWGVSKCELSEWA